MKPKVMSDPLYTLPLALLIWSLFSTSSNAQFGGGGIPGGLTGNLGGGGLGVGRLGQGGGGFSPAGLSPFAQSGRRFAGNLQLLSSYDTNINLQDGGGDGIFLISLGGDLTYRLGGESSRWGGFFNYSPNYRFFFDDRDLPGALQQGGGLSFFYAGASLTANLSANFNSGGGQNVLAGGFVDSFNYGLNGTLSLRFSPKTSIGITLGQQVTEIVDGQENTTSSFGLNSSWQATPLVSLGLFTIVSENELGLNNVVDSTAFGLSFNSTLTGKTSLTANLGLQEQVFEQGGSNTAFFGSAMMAWRPDDLYSFNLSLTTSTVALPGAASQIVNNYALNSNISRQLGIGLLALNLGYNLGQVESTIPGLIEQNDRRFVNANLQYSRPIFRQQMNLNASLGYRQGVANQDFSGFLSSLGLSYAF